jgi:hypothetical protein
MKNRIIVSLLLMGMIFFAGCKKDNYPGGQVSPYIAIYDLRNIHKGSDVTLTTENMFGSAKITGVVISDHSGKNMPEGLLVIQDRRRLSQLRGIAIPIGTAASNYVPGDSVIIDVEGAVLKQVDGSIQLTNITTADITKVSSGNAIPVNRVPTRQIVTDPAKYEHTLVTIVKGGFNPLPGPADVMAGDKMLNDGFGQMTLHTEAAATFANDAPPVLGNFFAIVFNKKIGDSLAPQLRMRTGNDKVLLSSVVEVAPIVISGFMSDVNGGDGNYEYAQFVATKTIDFSVTPYSVVFTNNANASTPTGFPANGWATGGMRTYKINLTSGTVARGEYFYVGGSNKLINGANSTSMASSNWIRNYNYVSNAGEGFGTATGGLLANSGNASGIAIFEGTTITAANKPIDVIFIGTGGSLFTAGPPAAGYRITNNDFYDIKNPITLVDQPFYRAGENTLAYAYNTADLGYFNMLGGVYNTTLGRWTTARAQNNVLLTKQSPVTMIESNVSTKVE